MGSNSYVTSQLKSSPTKLPITEDSSVVDKWVKDALGISNTSTSSRSSTPPPQPMIPQIAMGGMGITPGGFPSYMPPNAQALLDMYGYAPFSKQANTPQVSPVPRGLTYFNPYNTNPYLPMANPFALIANTPPSGS